jgi:hypothetical protein
MDPRTLWLARPDDRYQPTPALRSAERAVYPLLRAWTVQTAASEILPLMSR